MCIEVTKQGIILKVVVAAGSKKTRILGFYDKQLKIAIHVPAENNKANECLIEFLSEMLLIPKSNILIKSGQTSRFKKILLIGLELSIIEDLLKSFN